MATFDVIEKPDSRAITVGRSPSVELRYALIQTDLAPDAEPDELEARLELESQVEPFFDMFDNALVMLPLASITMTPEEDVLGQWEAVAVSKDDPAAQASLQAVLKEYQK